MQTTGVKQAIDDGAMSAQQWLIVIITVLLNAVDGFDVLSSAFAGPGIKQEWQLAPDGLGAVLSMELIGMGIGSLVLGGAADKIGRRPTMLICLVLMASGMFLATTAQSPQGLSVWRVLTGLGIGGMLASTNAVVNEVSNRASRSIAVALMVIGYPLGAFFGGLVAADLLATYSWRAIFMFGGIMTALMFPVALIFVPETPAWLAQARPAGALERINKTMARFKLASLAALPPLAPQETNARLADIFAPAYRRVTLVLALGYAAHMLTFYYILKMAPSIIADPQFAGQSFTKGQGASVLAYANLGGAIGGACFGWCMHRFGIKRATIVALALSVLAVIHFGLGQSTLQGWTIAVIITGIATNAAVVGFYASFAASYPTHVTATGTGFALGVGRGGAALSPFLAGLLFAGQSGLMTTSIVMAIGSLLALMLFFWLPVHKAQ